MEDLGCAAESTYVRHDHELRESTEVQRVVIHNSIMSIAHYFVFLICLFEP